MEAKRKTHLLLDVDHMQDVAQIKQLRRRHGDDLKNPKSDMRDGEGVVVADVLAARLLGVAHEVRLLIAPHLDQIKRSEVMSSRNMCRRSSRSSSCLCSDLVGSRAEDQDAEDEQHREPDLANHCGVALHFIQQASQHVPFTHLKRSLRGNTGFSVRTRSGCGSLLLRVTFLS